MGEEERLGVGGEGRVGEEGGGRMGVGWEGGWGEGGGEREGVREG